MELKRGMASSPNQWSHLGETYLVGRFILTSHSVHRSQALVIGLLGVEVEFDRFRRRIVGVFLGYTGS